MLEGAQCTYVSNKGLVANVDGLGSNSENRKGPDAIAGLAEGPIPNSLYEEGQRDILGNWEGLSENWEKAEGVKGISLAHLTQSLVDLPPHSLKFLESFHQEIPTHAMEGSGRPSL